MRTRARGHLSEFAICLFVLLFLALFPLIDLIGLAMRAATICLLAHESVSQASKQETYPKALAAMQEQTDSFVSSGFGRLCALKAVNGYKNCGTDLYTVATKINGAGIATFGPNAGVTPPIDKASVFEFMCKCTYDVNPWVNLGHIPGLANVPGFGKPARLSFSAYRAPEFFTAIEGGPLVASSSGGSGSAGSVAGIPVQGSLGSYLNQAAASSSLPESSGGLPIWRDPQLFNQIAASGQTIVAQEVFIVPANSPWVSSGITVSAGETVWIDSRADGMWSVQAGVRTSVDANGVINSTQQNLVDVKANGGSLIGCEGSTPSMSQLPSSAANLFEAGDTLLNFPVTYPGVVSFMINDCYYQDNSGQQIVRIVVTR